MAQRPAGDGKTFTQATEQLRLVRAREHLADAALGSGRAVAEVAAGYGVAWWSSCPRSTPCGYGIRGWMSTGSLVPDSSATTPAATGLTYTDIGI